MAVCSKQTAEEQHARRYKSLVKVWPGSSWFWIIPHTKPKCLGAVFARTRICGRSALFAMGPAILRANAPTNQAQLRLRPLLHLQLHLQLQQDHMRVPLPLQPCSLLRSKGVSTQSLYHFIPLRPLSRILRLRHPRLRLLDCVLRLHHTFLSLLNQSLHLRHLHLRLRRLVPRLLVQILQPGDQFLRRPLRALQLTTLAGSMLISHQLVLSLPKSRSLGAPSSRSMSSVSVLVTARSAINRGSRKSSRIMSRS
jgi:hypothetical protein